MIAPTNAVVVVVDLVMVNIMCCVGVANPALGRIPLSVIVVMHNETWSARDPSIGRDHDLCIEQGTRGSTKVYVVDLHRARV